MRSINYLTQLRLDNNVSVDIVAKVLGISTDEYMKLEYYKDLSVMPVKYLIALAKLYNISPAELISNLSNNQDSNSDKSKLDKIVEFKELLHNAKCNKKITSDEYDKVMLCLDVMELSLTESPESIKEIFRKSGASKSKCKMVDNFLKSPKFDVDDNISVNNVVALQNFNKTQNSILNILFGNNSQCITDTEQIKNIGILIQKCRKANGLTLREVATTTGITLETLYLYESGESDNLYLAIVHAIYNTLGIESEYVENPELHKYMEYSDVVLKFNYLYNQLSESDRGTIDKLIEISIEKENHEKPHNSSKP